VYALKTLAKKSILKTDQYQHMHDEIYNLRAASSNAFIGDETLNSSSVCA